MRQVTMEDLGTIRFTSVPLGGVPSWVREEWVGLEVPCLFSHDGVPLNKGDIVRDLGTGLEIPDFPGYIVLQSQAINALEQKSPEAAEYWMDRGFPEHPYAQFLFDLHCAEVVKPVMTRKEFWQRFSDA
ncbi:hypothetical protein IPH92_02105 [Candidatus Kaiserbacteria bacterium]|nr:MAG: hypothetical protein IPH92_02105 [Candidatus Kaiserbacteria bacterium]